jgi:transmembrane sensor
MDEFEFNRLIEKYQQGLLSGRDKALVDEWFDALARENDAGIWSQEDKVNLKNKILKEIGHSEKMLYVRKSKERGSETRTSHYTLPAAACFLLAVALSYALWQTTERKKPEEIAPVEVSSSLEIKKAILPDGSIVWLKGTSTLIYPQEFKGTERHVTLRGEGLFEVTRDPARPFVIQCGDLVTTVLGTSFNIKASEKNIEVLVLTGKVSVTANNDKKGFTLLPNEKAVYSKEQKHIAKVSAVDSRQEETIAAVATGTLYRMDFRDTRMEEVIHQIEGKFDVEIETPDPNVRNCMITADFTGQSLELTLSMISQALGFKSDIQMNRVILEGEGCL